MNKEQLTNYLNIALETGADFAEIYYEKTNHNTFRLNDSKLDVIDTNNEIGIGIRIIKKEESFYTSTTNLDADNIENTIKSKS